MQASLFGDNSAGQYIQVGRGDGSYRAFVPAPLPPDLHLSLELIRALSDADRALGELAGLGRSMPNPHLFIQPFVRREAVLSSRIEGTEADIVDVYAFEAQQEGHSGSSSPQHADAQEVYNYVKAMEYGLARLGSLPLSLRLIREMHARLMEGVRGERATPGEFRHSQNWIGPPGCSLIEASYVPPPVPQMYEALGAFEAYLHQEHLHPPLIRLAFIHYQFEAIHPFLDGNGRIGRLLIVLLLVHYDLLPLPLLYLSAYFERQREQYYQHLQAISDKAEWSSWVIFFLRGVAEQASDAIIRAKQLQDLQQRWRELLTQANTPVRVLHLADLLFQRPVVSISQAASLLGVPYKSAQRYTDRLLKADILKQLGDDAYGRSYYAPSIVQIVSSPVPMSSADQAAM